MRIKGLFVVGSSDGETLELYRKTRCCGALLLHRRGQRFRCACGRVCVSVATVMPAVNYLQPENSNPKTEHPTAVKLDQRQ